MKYFLYATTEKKPVMRFFDHWFELVDFIRVMKWDRPEHVQFLEVYQKIDEDELWNKMS